MPLLPNKRLHKLKYWPINWTFTFYFDTFYIVKGDSCLPKSTHILVISIARTLSSYLYLEVSFSSNKRFSKLIEIEGKY